VRSRGNDGKTLVSATTMSSASSATKPPAMGSCILAQLHLKRLQLSRHPLLYRAVTTAETAPG
jgi:hypothetical protein